ncbi:MULTISPECIES: MCE family protein [unclassified Rhodococcus (in: high G+C Gram-positive bacteria)]|uniref:MCE family protein n=1 Tax=unclassified Rhodococcus (in: high G+C Gram-positive bacteria) TaxID=192944 RepID=UPI0005679837|nr:MULTISPECIES: MCE family protein [unclassified Rhodococcus (in: high G+C Gram-positive bacteria)]MDQ1178907.1 phospholipid/cholesterol/gamma-HCH transport system substrate-binding protein [Rhodococcus sp. SORGH_AS_0301]MDQ1200187.1 phospholipid/cholesterol/gamma-HCH transport system substrate-binding protein [Rhodococcus sp. SORGH_AS_0303]
MTKRKPAVLGALGIFIILMATLSAFFLDSLPIIGAGSKYTANFSEAAGLRASNEVRIAGVKVGKVTDVALDGDKVKVEFTVSDAWVGDKTSASIQIKTLLGQKFLSLEPKGEERLNPRDAIPIDRTTAPYDVIDAFSDAARTTGDIDTTQLATSMETLSQAFSETPENIRASLDGVTRLSETISSRDDELSKLFAATDKTTQVLADRNQEFTKLIGDASVLLQELNNRQQSISQLLIGTQRVSTQLTGLIRDNEAQIGPALQSLGQVIDTLKTNNQNIAEAIKLYSPFVRLYTNIVGNGRWFDQVIVNTFPPGLPDIPGYREPIRTLGVDPVRSPGAGQ